jgi:uncharacterized C2H2 Zn-finger protein
MLEKIRTFFGRLKNKGKVVVAEGKLWRCTKCSLLFLTEKEGTEHVCKEA